MKNVRHSVLMLIMMAVSSCALSAIERQPKQKEQAEEQVKSYTVRLSYIDRSAKKPLRESVLGSVTLDLDTYQSFDKLAAAIIASQVLPRRVGDGCIFFDNRQVFFYENSTSISHLQTLKEVLSKDLLNIYTEEATGFIRARNNAISRIPFNEFRAKRVKDYCVAYQKALKDVLAKNVDVVS